MIFQRWNDVIGRTFRRMPQVHVTNASLWIAAAKYEIEEMGSAENARNLMQEAIRLNPRSRELFREVSDIINHDEDYIISNQEA